MLALYKRSLSIGNAALENGPIKLDVNGAYFILLPSYLWVRRRRKVNRGLGMITGDKQMYQRNTYAETFVL